MRFTTAETLLRSIFIAALAFTALVSAAHSKAPAPSLVEGKSSPPNQQTSAPQAHTKGPDHGAESTPLRVEIVPTEASEKEAKDRTAGHDSDSARDWWLVGFTGLLTLATIGLGWFTYKLWRVTAQAVADGKETGGAAQRSATAAEEATKIGQKSLDISQETAAHQLRAYLICEGFNLEFSHLPFRQVAETVLMTLHIRITNSGITPAKKVRYGGRFLEVDWPDGGEIKITRATDLNTFNIVVPGVPSIGTLKQAVSIDPISERAGNRRVYVLITVFYEDIFGREQYFEGHWILIGVAEGIDKFQAKLPLGDALRLEMVPGRSDAS